MDRFGNLNSTVIGPYESPRTTLTALHPGAEDLGRTEPATPAGLDALAELLPR